jgi:hypothetical protein
LRAERRRIRRGVDADRIEQKADADTKHEPRRHQAADHQREHDIVRGNAPPECHRGQSSWSTVSSERQARDIGYFAHRPSPIAKVRILFLRLRA